MATTAVASASKWLGDMLVEEAKYLNGVEKKVEQLQDELEWMQCFLQDVDARRDRDARMHKWIRQMTSLAYEAEDIIESFIVKVDLHRHGGLMSKLKRYSCIMREAKSLHEVGLDIDDLKLKISTLTSRLHTYGIKITEEGNGSEARKEQQLRKSYAHYLPDQENIVGLDDEAKKVVNQLLKDTAPCESRAVALCGMGGLGKTTLANKVYHHADVKNHFHAFAWACISQQCQVKSVLAELYRGLTSSEAGNGMTEASLMEKLHKVQKEKKCLVVLDDIWKNEAWDLLRKAFPVGQENSLGGKLLLTTRNDNVARYVDNKAFIHKQSTMEYKEAWMLLKKKLGRDPSNIFGEKHRDEMEKLAKEMLGHCGGLPMAIIALSGVLATKKSPNEWRATNKNIKALILSGAKDNGLSSEQVLELSYHDLPMYLKPCFLYLAVFPEDTEIEVKQPISLWMAEGFIITTSSQDDYYDDDKEQERSWEELGRKYLDELVDRSLVQIGSIRTNSGRIKTCRVHDLVRELCLSKAAKEYFLKVVIGGRKSSTTVMPSPSAASTKRTYRRLAFHGVIDDLFWDKMKYYVSCSSSSNAPHVKSILLLAGGTDLFIAQFIAALHSLKRGKILYKRPKAEFHLPVIMKIIFKEFRYIRVLDLANFRMEALPEEVGDMVYLRYLSITDSGIKSVPSSIGNLLSLQTLDLRCRRGDVRIPGVIWRMKQLKHLYLPKDYILSGELITRFEIACKVHRVALNNLEILHGLRQLYMLKYMSQLSNLRELTVAVKLDRQGLKHIWKIQSVLYGRLERLSIKLDWDVFVEEVDALRDLSTHLRNELKLSISGTYLSARGGSLAWSHHKFPNNLTNLYLSEFVFEDFDPLQTLGNLPKLRKLALHCCGLTKNVTCSQGGFCELTSFQHSGVKDLEEWTIEEGAMQSLRSLTIRGSALKIMPDGIKHIRSVQYLCIESMPSSFCDRVRVRRRMEERVEVEEDRDRQASLEEGPDVHKVRHIPCIILTDEI